MLINSYKNLTPLNFGLKYVVTCVTGIVMSNNITKSVLVMRYITAIQQKVIYYCNHITFVMRYSQHCLVSL